MSGLFWLRDTRMARRDPARQMTKGFLSAIAVAANPICWL
jgi:hypothetical protein